MPEMKPVKLQHRSTMLQYSRSVKGLNVESANEGFSEKMGGFDDNEDDN